MQNGVSSGEINYWFVPVVGSEEEVVVGEWGLTIFVDGQGLDLICDGFFFWDGQEFFC